MTAKEHNKIIGILHLIEGGLQLFVGIFAPLFLWVMYEFIKRQLPLGTAAEQDYIIKIFFVAGGIFSLLLLTFAAVNLIAGWKMLKEKRGARLWGIVASIICLPNVPLGTAIGIYGLWFFFGVEGKEMYLK